MLNRVNGQRKACPITVIAGTLRITADKLFLIENPEQRKPSPGISFFASTTRR